MNRFKIKFIIENEIYRYFLFGEYVALLISSK